MVIVVESVIPIGPFHVISWRKVLHRTISSPSSLGCLSVWATYVTCCYRTFIANKMPPTILLQRLDHATFLFLSFHSGCFCSVFGKIDCPILLFRVWIITRIYFVDGPHLHPEFNPIASGQTQVYYSKGLDSGHAMYPIPDNIIHLKTIATTSTLE